MAPHSAAVAAAAVYVAIAAGALLPRPASASGSLAGVGVNWGTMMSHPIYPPAVVEMLRANGVGRVKLFDADPWTVAALAGSSIEAMLAAPNDQLASLARDPRRAREWVRHNVTANLDAGVDVRYVAVGNEPFLKSYNGSFINITFPALKNMQRALNEAGFGQRIKAVVPLNADVYSSPANKPVPSAGSFRRDINTLMVDIVNFLHMNDAPFVVNIYPYLSLYQNPNFPLNFSFFDGRTKPVYDKGMVYTNVFDANFDTLVWSLRKAGVPDMKIIVGEIGWPTDGDKNANVKYAQRFYNGFLKKMAKNIGTPLRPGHMEVYLFALIDENQKSVLPGRFERHWGLFTYDGKPKFFMDLGGNGRLVGVKGVQYLPAQWCVFNKDAKDKYKNLPDSVNYACSNADCTPLGYGSSCNGLSHDGNISYAFNIYFQTMDQDVRACSFGGLAEITTTNASQGGCLFPVQILSASGSVVPLIFLPISLALLSKSLCSSDEVKEFCLDSMKEITALENEFSEEFQCIGFCHNDLQYGNIMIDEDTNVLTIISLFDHRFPFVPTATDIDERKRFVQTYLTSSGVEPDTKEVEDLINNIEKYTLASHLVWGLWGIISDHVNDIDFDYKEYARQRFEQYWLKKPAILTSQIAE
ncbi:hypothetical protein PR202_gb01941 [Eleusine coracana subsp. coracana]|uniref:glucan endo-1,3-beta-D-glucosidase n=1 Tax=Eleusine coracana subsp. coracana TaxID=191504 RepID=A0AAV5DWG6_ELECO|nr:hypothetical protein PR202_gb01941 [Eleusine coracana subsp. coracana]